MKSFSLGLDAHSLMSGTLNITKSMKTDVDHMTSTKQLFEVKYSFLIYFFRIITRQEKKIFFL